MTWIDMLASKVALHPVLASNDTWYDYNDAATPSGAAKSATSDMVSNINSAGSTLQTWAGLIVGMLGVVALIVGVYLLVKMLMAKGNGQHTQISWPLVLIVFVVGGIMAVGGFAVMNDMGVGMMDSIPSPRG